VIHFVVPAAHDAMMREYLELWGRDVAPRLRVVHAESLTSLRSFPRGTYVLSALDQYGPAMATFIAAFHTALSESGAVRFLNHPSQTLQRFALLDELYRRQRNTFRAIHVGDDVRSLRYPVFLRGESTHDGALSPLLHSPVEVEAAVGRALVQGRQARQLLLVEFCDTADADGYYRKYSAFVIGRHIVPRSLSYARDWMLKFQGSEFSRRMAEEEGDYVLTNPHGAVLRELFDLAKVGYGRIDYAVKDGRIQTWEMNLNPTIGRGLRASTGKVPAELDAIRNVTKHHFYRCFREAWHDVDVVGSDAAPIAIEIDPAVVQRAHAVDGTRPGWLGTVRRVLRPAKALIAPFVTLALPVIGRAAIRRARS
jgi:hypothetical protein